MMELMEETFHIRELEISITSRCTLACAHCEFLVPKQPLPSIGEPVAELAETLANLFKAGVRVQSLAVLGENRLSMGACWSVHWRDFPQLALRSTWR